MPCASHGTALACASLVRSRRFRVFWVLGFRVLGLGFTGFLVKGFDLSYHKKGNQIIDCRSLLLMIEILHYLKDPNL